MMIKAVSKTIGWNKWVNEAEQTNSCSWVEIEPEDV